MPNSATIIMTIAITSIPAPRFMPPRARIALVALPLSSYLLGLNALGRPPPDGLRGGLVARCEASEPRCLTVSLLDGQPRRRVDRRSAHRDGARRRRVDGLPRLIGDAGRDQLAA
jgi:hypothetical protein